MSDQTGSWQPDPFGRNQYRYWDGTQWTDQVSNNGVVSADPPTAAAAAGSPAASEPTQAVPTTPPAGDPTMSMPAMPPTPPVSGSGGVAAGAGGGGNKTPLIIVAVLAVVALIAGGAFLLLKKDDSDTKAAETTTTTEEESTTTTDDSDEDFDLDDLGEFGAMFGDLTVTQLECIEKEMVEFEKKYDLDSLDEDPENFDFGMLGALMDVFTKCDVDAEALFGGFFGGDFDFGDDSDFGFESGNTYGDNPVLDQLWDACAAGDMEACDDLYFQSDFGTEYEEFADTCGGRTSGGTYCSE